MVNVARSWLEGRPPEGPDPSVDPAAFGSAVRHNRLAPLMHLHLGGLTAGREWDRVLDSFRTAYQKQLIHAARQRAAATELIGRLEEAGIPCIGLRGVFAAEDLYGDMAARHFTDIDLLVPPDQRRAALAVARAAGYSLWNPLLPERFYERHHLHWPLMRGKPDVVCDLHWALDHPYRLLTIDYTAIFRTSSTDGSNGWRRPSSEHLLLINCIHLLKHCRGAVAVVTADDNAGSMVRNGWLLHWLDIAAILRRFGGELNWDRILETATEWRCEEGLAAGVLGAVRVLGAQIPSAALAQVTALAAATAESPVRGPSPRWVRKLAELGGFRSICLGDAWRFILPERSYFVKGQAGMPDLLLRRALHALKAATTLVAAAAETVALGIWIPLRRRFGRETSPSVYSLIRAIESDK
ncbi:MAG: hypothetical protein BWK77_09270 [Verrucomicrobia bacterium A1]|nr:MAG: hypothetical protein BWK77_09270 [Verrucomicrobia bacterium A1]